MHLKKNALVMILILSSAYCYAPDDPCYLHDNAYNSSLIIVERLLKCSENDDTDLYNLNKLNYEASRNALICGEAWGRYVGYNEASKELWSTPDVTSMVSFAAMAGLYAGNCIAYIWLKRKLRKGSNKAAEDIV